MRQKILSFIILIIGLIVYLRFVIPPKGVGPEKVEDVIWKMFSSAKSGDIQQYLDCFTGQSLTTLQAAREQKTDEVFRRYIKQNALDVKGVSIINGGAENSRNTSFDVEVVYTDRNELQIFSLQQVQGQGGWKISQVSKPVIVKQPIPYMELVVKE